MKSLIILGSSRSDGNTARVVNQLQQALDADVIDLLSKNIHRYDYGHIHRDDDFLPVMRQVVTYDVIIFASPVYWYSMSGAMKNFFDRITDCLKIEKETGRKLRGKQMAVLSCSGDAEAFECFFEPFRLSADYLGMRYAGEVHTWADDDEDISPEVQARVHAFAKVLQDSFGG